MRQFKPGRHIQAIQWIIKKKPGAGHVQSDASPASAANECDVQYQKLLQEILKSGQTKGDRTGVGTKSIFGHQMRFDLRQGFPLLTTKKLHTRSIVHELIWFLRGDTDLAYLKENNVTIWDEWATADQCAKFGRAEGNLGPVYGHQWRNFGATL